MMCKRTYLPPEFNIERIWLIEDVLNTSTGNHDHVDVGGDVINDSTNPDINNDNYDLGDGFDIFN